MTNVQKKNPRSILYIQCVKHHVVPHKYILSGVPIKKSHICMYVCVCIHVNVYKNYIFVEITHIHVEIVSNNMS